MKKNKQPAKYYMPSYVRAHLVDQKERVYIVTPGFVKMIEAEKCINDMIARTSKDKCPFISGWTSQDIIPVF